MACVVSLNGNSQTFYLLECEDWLLVDACSKLTKAFLGKHSTKVFYNFMTGGRPMSLSHYCLLVGMLNSKGINHFLPNKLENVAYDYYSTVTKDKKAKVRSYMECQLTSMGDKERSDFLKGKQRQVNKLKESKVKTFLKQAPKLRKSDMLEVPEILYLAGAIAACHVDP